MIDITNGFIKNEFINDYGDYADDFSLVSSDGSMHWSIIIFFILFFIFIASAIGLNNKEKKEKNKNKKKLFKYASYGLFGISAITILLVIIKFISYNLQWMKWYKSLPSNGKSDYNKMKLIKGLTNNIRNNSR